MIAKPDGEDARLTELLLRWEELHEQGQSVTPLELCSTCPELAEELGRRIALLRQLGPALADATTSAAEQRLRGPGPADGSRRESASARADYHDLRYHASGALGEVFLAKNAELNREVALKFLKSSRARDPASLRRFLQEAEVTGRLEHPGIVPIYTLGADAAGAPCYAMRFIRGATLQDAVDAFHTAERPGRDSSERSLALRELLTRFVSVCTTVAYAHSRGILHRDLKPRNVMLGRYDETLVVDWGLAKPFAPGDATACVGEEALLPSSGSSGSGSDAPTVGVVGTLAYMSPEQGQARWDVVGPASDIFSLGAVLYAILTGCAPYRAGAEGEIIERVKHCRFPKPREVKPEAPRALEAICLKAMAARPADRYATALELAGDVKCWLADQPVTAWREPVSVRARRWARRHRTLVTSAAAVLVLSLVGLAGFAAVLAGKNRELDRQRQRAEGREALAIDAVQKFRDMVQANAELKNRPELEALRKALLKEPLEFFRKLRDQLQSDRDTRPEALAKLADANFELAWTSERVGSAADAIRSYTESIAIRERLARAHPAGATYEKGLAGSHNNLGNLLLNTGDPAGALKSLLRANELQERAARANPTAVDYQRDLAKTHYNIGLVLNRTGRLDEAMQWYRRALAIFDRIERDNPSANGYQADLANTHNNIGCLLNDAGRPAEALESHRRALEIRQRLVQETPGDARRQRDLAGSHDNIGISLDNIGRRAEALQSHQRALEIRQRLVQEDPTNRLLLSDLARAQNNVGETLTGLGRLGEALQLHRQALEIGDRLMRDHPSIHAYQGTVGLTLNYIAEAEIAEGRWREARDRLEQANKHLRAALSAMPRDPFYQQVFKLHLLDLAKVHQALKQPAEAIRVVRELAGLARGSPADHYHVACALAQCVLLTRGDQRQTLAAEAVQTLKEAVAAGWNDAGKTSRDLGLAPLRDRDDFRRLVSELFDRGFPADPFAR
jgi:serine/threonine-protein kinase